MRKAKPKKSVILQDPVFNDVKVSKFVNNLTARKIFRMRFFMQHLKQ